jgi:membrane-associated phospholipid phosphatase
VGAAAVTFLLPTPDKPRWSGGILFDDDVRAALRARDPAVRDAIRVASDITLLTNVLQTTLVDGLLLPMLDHNPSLAAQLSLINAQAFAFNMLVATVLFKLAARERPLISGCRLDDASDPLCKIGEYASFPSSHTSTAFTAAGLTCITHGHLPLYGGGAWDVVACMESLVVAAATGLFRIIGDRHYATDVLVGAALGFSIGYLLPWLFHYRYAPGMPEHTIETTGVRSPLELAPAIGLHFGGVLE